MYFIKNNHFTKNSTGAVLYLYMASAIAHGQDTRVYWGDTHLHTGREKPGHTRRMGTMARAAFARATIRASDYRS
jgi:hypothetical protein